MRLVRSEVDDDLVLYPDAVLVVLLPRLLLVAEPQAEGGVAVEDAGGLVTSSSVTSVTPAVVTVQVTRPRARALEAPRRGRLVPDSLPSSSPSSSSSILVCLQGMVPACSL